MITKEEWFEWKGHPVTEMILREALEEMQQGVGHLIERAGDEPLKDKFATGKIKGLLWFIDYEPELNKEDKDDA